MGNITMVDEVVAGWRRGEDPDSPAGPLYVGGDYAESDIAMISDAMATCSWCTASGGGMCC